MKTAIEDVGNLKMGVWKQEMVPFKEMPDVLKIVKDVVGKLRAGSWVRLKRTIYKDDLAQVEHVDTAQNQVTLKIVPRIDYTQKRGALREKGADAENKRGSSGFGFGGFKRKLRPPPRLFDVEAVREVSLSSFV